MTRKFIPLYVVLLIALVAVIYWREHEEQEVSATPKPVVVAAKRKRKWAFLPPVSYYVR